MQVELRSGSPVQTFEAGEKLSRLLHGGDILLFSGELGGGKTTFISGLAKGLNVKDNLSSPSFTILNEYRAVKLKFVHVDLYRLDGMAEIENIGLDEYIYDDSCIICIEWGEKAKDFIKKQFLVLDFQYIMDDDSANERRIIIEGNSPAWEKRLKKLERILKG